jgi:hypothetical protein
MILYVVLSVAVIAAAIAIFAAAGGADTVGMSTNGLIAMAAGIVLSVGLAIGLMALVFHSNRSGRDEVASRHDGPEDEWR